MIHSVAILQKNVPDFIEPSNWPSNSPDQNPVDYSIWDALRLLVYRQKFNKKLSYRLETGRQQRISLQLS